MNGKAGVHTPLGHSLFKNPGMEGAIPARIRRWAVGQFRRPAGLGGRLAGWIMAHRPSNILRNRWTVDLLEVQPAERVLEIGFGPGLALRWLGERAPQGMVHGIDHSGLMVRQAARRNAKAIREGRLRLHQGPADRLPEEWGMLDKVMAVNVVMFWEEPVEQLRRLHERITPGGRIALTLQPRAKGANFKDALRAGRLMTGYLEEAGFREPRLEILPLRPVAAVCALALR